MFAYIIYSQRKRGGQRTPVNLILYTPRYRSRAKAKAPFFIAIISADGCSARSLLFFLFLVIARRSNCRLRRVSRDSYTREREREFFPHCCVEELGNANFSVFI